MGASSDREPPARRAPLSVAMFIRIMKIQPLLPLLSAAAIALSICPAIAAPAPPSGMDRANKPVVIETGAESESVVQPGQLTGTGGLVKTGTGTLLLVGSNDFSGPTVVRSGTLKLGRAPLPEDLRIMPMGDSITYGDKGPDAGYRGPLFKLLKPLAAGFTYVGSLATVQANLSLPADQHRHEGHSGWTAAQLTAGNFLAPGNGVDPDVILLQIGTNDLLGGGYRPQLQSNLETLLTQLSSNRPSARIILATLPPSTKRKGVAEYNTMVLTVAATFHAAGKKITLCDNNSNFPAEGLADGTHPNEIGYQWLAKQWLSALFSLHSSGGTSQALSHSASVTVEENATLDVNENIAATGNLIIKPGGNLAVQPTANLRCGGSVTLAGKLSLTAPPGLAPGSRFTILEKTSPGAISGTFTDHPEASTFTASGYEWRITYTGSDGNDVVLSLLRSTVP